MTAICVVLAGTATAAVDVSASATAGVMYNSNVLDRASSEGPPFAATGNTHRDDTSTNLAVGAGAEISGNTLRMQVNGQVTRVESRRFDSLSRNDHNIAGSLDWTPVKSFDATLQVSRLRAPAEYADVSDEEIRQQTQLQAALSMRVRPTPRWQISLSPPGLNNFRLPLDGAPEFEFREYAGSAAIDYLGGGRLVPGVVVTYARGEYSGIEDATRYRQRGIQATLNYATSGLSTLSVAAGYAQRETRLVEPSDDPAALASEGDDSAFTGALNLYRQLTYKTSLNVGAFRYFQQYYAGVNTTVGTGFNAGVTWAATTKVSVTLDAQHVWSTIWDLRVAGTVMKREDLVRSYSLGVGYQAMRRVSLRTYFTRRIRNSTVGPDQFNGNIAGVELAARLD